MAVLTVLGNDQKRSLFVRFETGYAGLGCPETLYFQNFDLF